MTAKLRISAVLITKNEAPTLARCLDSLRGNVDEIIVLDTGSTDATVALARVCGATVYEQTFEPWSFAAARNAALDHATGDWIVSLDADEVLDAVTAPNLRALVARVATLPFPSMLQPLMLNLNDREGTEQWQEFHPSRIFPRHPDIRWERPIHEQIRHLGQDIDGHVTNDLVVRHYGYTKEALARQAKSERNMAMLLARVTDAPEDMDVWHELGRQHEMENRPAEALAAFQRYLDDARGRGLAGHIRAAGVYMFATRAALLVGKPFIGVALSAEGLGYHPDYAGLWNNRGTCLLAIERFDEAAECFRTAIALRGHRTSYEDEQGSSGWRPWWNLALLYQNQGEHVRAIECYAEAIKDFPANPRLPLGMAAPMAAIGEIAEARKILGDVLARWPDHTPAQAMLEAMGRVEALQR